jgi:hypothetical protein
MLNMSRTRYLKDVGGVLVFKCIEMNHFVVVDVARA